MWYGGNDMHRVVLAVFLLAGCRGQSAPEGNGAHGSNLSAAPAVAGAPDLGSGTAGSGTAGSGMAGSGTGGSGTAAVAVAETSGIDAGTGGPPSGCRDRVASAGSGYHLPGTNCFAACHDHGFTFGGTIYTSIKGARPLPGATITLVDASGKSLDVVSQANGNFYTSEPIAFPLTVTASLCPNSRTMRAKLTEKMIGCNRTECHTVPAEGRIHLP